jgi:hypothetical protein
MVGMSRRGSRIYVHLVVVVGMRIVNWGIGRFKGYVAEFIASRNGSVMCPLTMSGQNGCILFAILDQFGF